MNKLTVYNTLKSRLETITFEFTNKNTTWFDDGLSGNDVQMITDAFDGLLISQRGYRYPIWIDDKSRADIANSKYNALKLIRLYTEDV